MQKSSKKYEFDPSFYRLANEIAKVLSENKDGTDQKQQVEELLDAEKRFKEEILKVSKQSTEIYKKFLIRICVQNKNILSARPYFRETATTFSKKITPAIKNNNLEELKKFDINYQFIKFIRDNWRGPFSKKAEQLFERVHAARTKLIQNNMPLAINRAKLFFRKTPQSHLTLMDMISICSMGLAAGIDKYVGKYTPVFRSVCIGRMVGNLIDNYSETMLHFYPSDKRVLYKANSLRGREGISETRELTEAIKESFKRDALEGKSVPKQDVTVSELHSLMGASSTISADSVVNEEGFAIYDYTADSTLSIEESMIEDESTNKMLALSRDLPLLYKKVLRLKGIKI